MTVVVIAPVLGRPQNARRLSESLRKSGATARLVFVCSPGDDEQIAASQKVADTLIVDWQPGPADWSRKINWALTQTTEEWVLLGADDLRFDFAWEEQALRTAEQMGCSVIGTNDLGNAFVMRGQLATHALVRRDYAVEHGTIDEPGKILHEGYYHNFVDVELTETARARGQFAFARKSIVEHLHPAWGKSVMDTTYEKALDKRHFEKDRRLLLRRRRLWTSELRRIERRALRGARR